MELEQDKSLKRRWEVAINKLSAPGASAGLHVKGIYYDKYEKIFAFKDNI